MTDTVLNSLSGVIKIMNVNMTGRLKNTNIMRFKRLSVVIMTFLMMILSGNAQNVISSFYGFKLGMTESQVINSLSQRSINYERKHDSTNNYLQIKNVKLGDCNFQTLNLILKNGKLVRGVFYSDDAAGGNPEAYAFSRMEQSAREYKNDFNLMYANLSAKYGAPNVSDSDQYIWIKQNKLTISYSYNDNYDSPYMRQAWTNVRVVYELIDSASVNY